MKNSKPLHQRKTISALGKKGQQESNIKLDTNREQICDICAQNVPGPERERIFAFGKCDHYVCYVCSTRLRVICDQSECPICREKLDSVIFSGSRTKSYAKYNLKDYLFNEKYNIYFENKLIQSAFDKLLRYQCQKCINTTKAPKSTIKKSNDSKLSNDSNIKPVCSQEQANNSNKLPKHHQDAPTISSQKSDGDSSTNQSSLGNQSVSKRSKAVDQSSQINAAERIEEDAQGLLRQSDIATNVYQDVFGLKNHLNYVHKLKLCDLCLTHNKLFPFEYSYYDSIALKKHMLQGEPKTPHCGHPKCALCQENFFNNDELLQHMSREHFHCHLCGRRDTDKRLYFIDYDSLRIHFKDKHFLCERDNCRHEQFTSAFDSEIDYQVHLVQVHGSSASNLSRGEARHRGTITLHSAPHRARPTSPDVSGRQNAPRNSALVSTGTMATANSSTRQLPESILAQIRQQRMPSRADFPALGHAPASSNSLNSHSAQISVPVTNINHYPSLPQTTMQTQASSSSNATITQRLTAGPSNSRNSFVRTVGGGYRAAEQLNEMDFPPLPEQPKLKGNKKPKAQQLKQQNNFRARDDTSGGMTLDQLISTSLTLSNRNNRFNGKKPGSKGGSSKSAKVSKQKAIKIQLS